MRERVVCVLAVVAYAHADQAVLGPLLYELAERRGAMRASGGGNQKRLNHGGLTGAIRPPKDLGSACKGDVARSPTANLL